MADNILVIKLGALGDFILAQSAFAAIRAHHPQARITLLTTRPFAELAAASPYFDEVAIDEKPKWNPLAWISLWLHLIVGRFSRVYDLQTSGRSALYYRLFWPYAKPEWSGIARGCSHPDPTPERAKIHAWDLRARQLQAAGIAEVPFARLDWLTGGNRHTLPKKSILLVPGCSPHRPEKRWPALYYAGLAARLVAKGFTPVIIGGETEKNIAGIILSIAPGAIDLTTETSLFDIADLARAAIAAIGNDTGPMHLIAAAGCPSLVLFSGAADPAHSSPRGERVGILQRNDLAQLDEAEVETALQAMI